MASSVEVETRVRCGCGKKMGLDPTEEPQEWKCDGCGNTVHVPSHRELQIRVERERRIRVRMRDWLTNLHRNDPDQVIANLAHAAIDKLDELEGNV